MTDRTLDLILTGSLLLSPFLGLLAVAWHFSSRLNQEMDEVLSRLRVSVGGIHSRMEALDAKLESMQADLKFLRRAGLPAPQEARLGKPPDKAPEIRVDSASQNPFKQLLDYTD